MTLYIILIFSAICVGMAISVKAFGTGGKRKRIFQDIYFSIEEVDGIGEKTLFPADSAFLQPQFIPLVNKVSDVLADIPGMVVAGGAGGGH